MPGPLKTNNVGPVNTGSCGRRGSQRPALSVPTGSLEGDSQWVTQINRLQKLIDRLERKMGAAFSPFLLLTR